MALDYGMSKDTELPFIRNNESFSAVIKHVSSYVHGVVRYSASFEELRTPSKSESLNRLASHLINNVRHRQIVPALLALRSYFEGQTDDEPGVNITRAYACEYVAWRYVLHLSEWEIIDCLLGDLDLDDSTSPGSQAPGPAADAPLLSSGRSSGSLDGTPRSKQQDDRFGRRRERPVSLRISNVSEMLQSTFQEENGDLSVKNDAFALYFNNLNALEVAAVSNAKKFLSQRVIQRVIERIWKGDIVFWETMSAESIKEAKVYNKRKADPFCRLRVPRYLKFFEAIFFLTFLGLYYAVLVPIQRNGHRPSRRQPVHEDYSQLPIHQSDATTNFHSITGPEVLLYVWIAGFAYDEFGEFLDAGQAFYATDFWSLWDLGIVVIGLVFFICRVIGLVKQSDDIIGVAFDILSLEALFLVPRICSVLSLNSYFGTLIPCLREMTKDFVKFLSLVIILYIGFLTTFTLLARDNFTARQMTVILVKVFFGSSYLGFEVASEISPVLGWPLMLIFVILTNILLITSLISLLSNSLAKVLEHAREEYLYIYSVYVLEASTSNRLTYYLPPLNLLALLLRPLKLFISPTPLRRIRIVLLKLTHAPWVAAIRLYEAAEDYLTDARSGSRMQSSSTLKGPSTGVQARGFMSSSPEDPRLALETDVTNTNHADVTSNSSGRPAETANSPSNEDLKELVLRLMSRVEDLSAQLSSQR